MRPYLKNPLDAQLGKTVVGTGFLFPFRLCPYEWPILSLQLSEPKLIKSPEIQDNRLYLVYCSLLILFVVESRTHSCLCKASEITEDPFKAKPIWQKSPPPPSLSVTWPGNVLDSYKQVIRRLHSRQLSGFNINSDCKREKPDKSIICLPSSCWKSTHYTVQAWM